MTDLSPPRKLPFSPLAWLVALLLGVAAPAGAMAMLVAAPLPVALSLIAGPILALGLMGSGMIAAAAVGRLWIGIGVALVVGTGLVLLARILGMAPLPHPVSTAFAFLIASFSFAARGALFARSTGARGWWIALFVVAGEAAMLVTAATLPGRLPDWLLVLLPAQWASMAIQTALTGTGTRAAASALFALAGTGAVTLLVARLWPRRWPYALMFSAWLGLSALVWYRPAPPMPHVDLSRTLAGKGKAVPASAAPRRAPEDR